MKQLTQQQVQYLLNALEYCDEQACNECGTIYTRRLNQDATMEDYLEDMMFQIEDIRDIKEVVESWVDPLADVDVKMQ